MFYLILSFGQTDENLFLTWRVVCNGNLLIDHPIRKKEKIKN